MPLGRTLPIFALCLLPFAADASDWTRFRGPNGSGVAEDRDIPVKFGNDNLLWKVPLAGVGNSSPVVWKGQLYVQTTTKNGSERALVCIDIKDGAVKWKQSLPAASTKIHSKNSLASSSPAVDALHVYCFFWDGSKVLLKAYTHAGKEVWSRDLGGFASQHGFGVSPIPVGDKVIFTNDQDTKSVLMAFDAKTGATAWEQNRDHVRACYSSPMVRELPDGKTELLIVSTIGATGYDPANGAKNWHWEWKFTGMRLRTTSSPVLRDGMLFATSGDSDNGPRTAVAVRIGKDAKLVWENSKRIFPYVPSMLIHGNHLYFVNDRGNAGCFEAETGKQIWYQQLQGDFTSSPILIDGKMYAINEEGTVFVLAAAPKFQLLATNALNEMVRATPAVADHRLFIRGQQHLFCIGNGK